MNIIELQVEFIITRCRWFIDDRNSAIIIIAKTHFYFGWSFHRKTDATSNASFFTIDGQLIILVHFAGADIWATNFHFFCQFSVRRFITRNITLEWWSDDFFSFIFNMDFVLTTCFRYITNIDWTVFRWIEVYLRFRWTFIIEKSFVKRAQKYPLKIPSKATVNPDTGFPDVKTVNLFSIPAMPLTKPPPCAEILIIAIQKWKFF